MAKSWCGFLPQNQNVMEQWGALEASSGEILNRLKALPRQDENDGSDPLNNDLFSGWPYDTE
jgi:hypothetical protein